MSYNNELEQLIEKRERLLDYIKCQEYGNDFYYTMGTYREDKAELAELNKRIDELKGKANE